MASCFCVSTARPGLLGQLMLATVATHAARNSLSAWGSVDLVSETVFFVVVQLCIRKITTA
jgi:hypothetical protein